MSCGGPQGYKPLFVQPARCRGAFVKKKSLLSLASHECSWVGSLDFNFLGVKGVFRTKPSKSDPLFEGLLKKYPFCNHLTHVAFSTSPKIKVGHHLQVAMFRCTSCIRIPVFCKIGSGRCSEKHLGVLRSWKLLDGIFRRRKG